MRFASRHSIGLSPTPSRRPRRGPRAARIGTLATLAAMAALVVTSTGVFASTPVAVGYKDFLYGGGAARPTADKPQSKLWFTDGTWWAGMFYFHATAPVHSEYRIWKLSTSTHTWSPTSTIIDTRDKSHADYLWDEGSQSLYVASTHPIKDTANPDDSIWVWRYHYAAGVYTQASKVAIPGTASSGGFPGGSESVSVAKDSSGNLWAVWVKSTTNGAPAFVMYSESTDNALTWSTPAALPPEGTNSVMGSDSLGGGTPTDTAAVVAFGTNVGIMWSDHNDIPVTSATDGNGYWFASIAAGADPTVGGNWTLDPKVPSLIASATDGQQADNHLNVKVASDGTIYAVGKTGKDTTNCATNLSSPNVVFFKRTTGAVWSTSLVSTVGDCETRPQIVLDEQLGNAYVFLSSRVSANTANQYVYVKSAPLSGPDAFKFRGAADSTIQLGVPFIQSATELRIDDPTTTKQILSATTDLVVNAGNNVAVTSNTSKWYLHNEMTLPAADATAPVGALSVNSDAAFTTTPAVSVAETATDAGSGLSLVRLANAGGVDGNGVLNGAGATSYAVGNATLAWNLTAGDGAKTVFAQWRDAAGNWSTPTSKSITVDSTAPTGTVQINGGASNTTSLNVTLDLTESDGTGSGTASVLVSNDNTTFTTIACPTPCTSVSWTLAPVPLNTPTSRTAYVKFVDAVGNTSAAVSDSITVTINDGIPPSAPGVPLVRFSPAVSSGVPVRLSWTAATDNTGISKYIVYRRLGASAWTIVGQPTTTFLDIPMPNGVGWRLAVRAVDSVGNAGPVAYTATTFGTKGYSEISSGVTYTGTWGNSTSTVYVGGHAKVSVKIGSTSSLKWTGKSVAWESRRTPTSGKARVYINNVLVATIDLFAASNQEKQVVFQKTYSTSGTRTLKIVLIGPSTRPRVTVDSYYVIQ